jgi:uncharacterized lipoprotein YajG
LPVEKFEVCACLAPEFWRIGRRMKKLFPLIAVFGLVCVGLLAGCSKSETPATPDVPSTNAPSMTPTNAPAMPSTNTP